MRIDDYLEEYNDGECCDNCSYCRYTHKENKDNIQHYFCTNIDSDEYQSYVSKNFCCDWWDNDPHEPQ